MKRPFDAHAAVDQLAAIYDESVANLREALARYVDDRTAPDARARNKGAFAYPELRIDYAGKLPASAPARAFARLNQPGAYATSIARPELFRDYLVEQLEHLSRDYDVSVSVGRSASEIPYAYVIENSGIEVGDIGTAELSRFFPSNELVHIGDEISQRSIFVDRIGFDRIGVDHRLPDIAERVVHLVGSCMHSGRRFLAGNDDT